MGDYKYRFATARGLERRKFYSAHWERVTPECLASMTPGELRHVADVIEQGEQSDG